MVDLAMADGASKKMRKEKKKNKQEKGEENGAVTPKKEKKRTEQENCEENGETKRTEKRNKKDKSKRRLENGDLQFPEKKLKFDPEDNSATEESKSDDASNDMNGKRSQLANRISSKFDLADKSGTKMSSEPADLSDFRICSATVEKLKARGISSLFPIQANTFDFILDGHDVIGQARTGTGKTLAFAIPVAEKLLEKRDRKRGRAPKVLALVPTRELAKQVGNEFTSLSDNLEVLCVYGGTAYGPQESKIRSGVDVIVGTPGRLIDFLEKQTLDLSQLQHLILDEVDRMLDMGFADDVTKIMTFSGKPDDDESKPQTLLFSATMPPWVHNTAKRMMKEEPKFVNMVGRDRVKTATTVQHLAIQCSYWDRAATVGNVLSVYSGNHGRAMVFCSTKRDADALAMSSDIKQETHVMHGDIPQDKREMVLKCFREGRYKCLISTDVAARGLDIPEVDLVIQTSPPSDVDSYIHRSGRTGRAGRPGVCVCFYKKQEEYDLQSVEHKAGIKFKRIGAPTAQDLIEAAAKDVITSIEQVSDDTLTHFEASANRLIESKGASRALAAALALISGTTEIKSRSLLNSFEGFTTYLFRTTNEMTSKGYCFSSLRRKLPEEVMQKVSFMKMCSDKMGCVFDLASDLDSAIDDHWSDSNYDTLSKATELPELLDEPSGYGRGGGRGGYGGRGGGGFRGRGGFGGRGGRGGDRGGRGGGRGFGGRGGGRGGRGGSFSSFSSSPGQNKKTTFD